MVVEVVKGLVRVTCDHGNWTWAGRGGGHLEVITGRVKVSTDR